MKVFGKKGEVNARLDELDQEVIDINNNIDNLSGNIQNQINQLQIELNPEKLFDYNSGTKELEIQVDSPAQPVSGMNLNDRYLTGVKTRPTETYDAANVEFATKTAIKYALIF